MGRIRGFAAWRVGALPFAVALLGLWPSRVMAASATSTMSVSVTVPRRCEIRLGGGRDARPRPVCGTATAATSLPAEHAPVVRYGGPTDPVSVVRGPRQPDGSVVWVVTF